MIKMNYDLFSTKYEVRPLTENDLPIMFEICKGNPQYYEYRPEDVSIEELKKDMKALPPGIGIEDKYFVGYFQGEELIAYFDIISGFPREEVAYIGFFMMNSKYQGNGEGSFIISELLKYFKSAGFSVSRLGIDKGNPQSSHFWKKNGYEIVQETEEYLVAERVL